MTLVKRLGLKLLQCSTKSVVRLANQAEITSNYYVEAPVQLGVITSFLRFEVLECNVSGIVGIPFLQQLNPRVDWQKGRVFVKLRNRLVELPTHHTSVLTSSRPPEVKQKLSQSAPNRFADLEVHPGQDVEEVAEIGLKPKVAKKRTTRKRKPGNVIAVDGESIGTNSSSGDTWHAVMRAKTTLGALSDPTNASSSTIADVDTEVRSFQEANPLPSTLQPGDRDACFPAECVISAIETVSLRQFVRGAKKKQYSCCFLSLVDTSTPAALNFTHRTSHGDEGLGDTTSLGEKASSVLSTLKQKFPNVFQEPSFPIVREGHQFEHNIRLKDPNALPPKRKLYPLDAQELQELKAQIQLFLETNRIVPSMSPYGAPILFAKKKNGQLRMCIDYRQLNTQSIPDSFPLPRIDEMLQRLHGARYFSKLDLRDGYHQIGMNDADTEKTAFTCRYGTFEWKVMPFGLMNAPSTFQRVMNNVFMPLLDKGVLVYLDDILIYSKTQVEHDSLLAQVFSLLNKHQLFVKENKCSLYLETIEFLGHVVSAKGISMEPGKVQAMLDWPQPTCLNEVQQFLGLCNYYRKFVFRFSELASPLTRLTRKNVTFTWGSDQEAAFQSLKKAVTSAPVLQVFDPTLKIRVVCDASQFCAGAVLEQEHNGAWHPVEFLSKRLLPAEINYSATDREFVAIKLSLERWRHLLIGVPFLILTDHAPLTYLKSQAHVSRRVARWLDFMSQFDFQIDHIAGKANVVADHFSRVPGYDKVGCINAIISIFDKPTLLEHIRLAQEQCVQPWFAAYQKRARARDGVAQDREIQNRDGILCKLVQDRFVPVLPRGTNLMMCILRDLHNSGLGGHMGSKKLYKLCTARFYWQNMKLDVEQFCRRCEVCRTSKTSTQKPAGLLQPLEVPSYPYEVVTMDFIVQLPTSTRGFDGIFTIVDRFSKNCTFIPYHSNSNAAQVAQLFFEHIVCKFGMPRRIVSDRDSKFISLFWQSLMSSLQCTVALSTAYHPQTDGQSERFNRSVEQVLRCYCAANQLDWCKYLCTAEFALNSTVHAATHFSAFQVLFGRELSLPIDHALAGLNDCKVQGVIADVEARARVQKQVQRYLNDYNCQMKAYQDGKRRELDFTVGERVLLSTTNLSLPGNLSKKLAPKFIGPFKVVAQVSPVAFRLDLPPRYRQLHPIFHASQLRAAQDLPTSAREPIFVSAAEDEHFEVESILAHRSSRHGNQYLVSWAGYGPHDNTWEPEDNLEGAKKLLGSYKRRHSLM